MGCGQVRGQGDGVWSGKRAWGIVRYHGAVWRWWGCGQVSGR